MKRMVEVFTAGCPFCEPVVEMVEGLAGEECEVTIHNLSKDNPDAMQKIKSYTINRLPAVAVEGQLIDCCNLRGISKDDLIRAGVGACH